MSRETQKDLLDFCMPHIITVLAGKVSLVLQQCD